MWRKLYALLRYQESIPGAPIALWTFSRTCDLAKSADRLRGWNLGIEASKGLFDRSRLTHHLADGREMFLFGGDLLAGGFFEQNALTCHQNQQLTVFGQSQMPGFVGFLKNPPYVVPMSLEQLSDLERRMAAQRGPVLPRLDRVHARFVGLTQQP